MHENTVQSVNCWMGPIFGVVEEFSEIDGEGKFVSIVNLCGLALA